MSSSEDYCGESGNIINCSFLSYEEPCKKVGNKFNHPDVCTFKSLITPLSELTPYNSKTTGAVEFTMRRKNRVVSLQWQPFTGKLNASGVAYLSMSQTISNLPPYPVYAVYNLEYNGTLRQAPIQIDTTDSKTQVKFYLNSNGTAANVVANDTISVKAGCISWIV